MIGCPPVIFLCLKFSPNPPNFFTHALIVNDIIGSMAFEAEFKKLALPRAHFRKSNSYVYIQLLRQTAVDVLTHPVLIHTLICMTFRQPITLIGLTKFFGRFDSMEVLSQWTFRPEPHGRGWAQCPCTFGQPSDFSVVLHGLVAHKRGHLRPHYWCARFLISRNRTIPSKIFLEPNRTKPLKKI
jgi:hypothetical protein